MFEKTLASKETINELLQILRARDILEGHEDTEPIYASADDMHDTIDDYPGGATEWITLCVRWMGPVTANSPDWKRKPFYVHTRNPLEVMEHLAANPDFNGAWHNRPFRQYNQDGTRVWSDAMSGEWAWKQAVRSTELVHASPDELYLLPQNLLAQDPANHGAMFAPFDLAADKTTVSVATGNQEFHPLYMMSANVTNEMRRAHRDAIVPLAFLAIPKGEPDTYLHIPGR